MDERSHRKISAIYPVASQSLFASIPDCGQPTITHPHLSQAPPILLALAKAYADSVAGRTGGARDFTIDYEKLLRRAKLHDGDAREIAEHELHIAERQSAGGLVIDRHPRSGQKLRVRLTATTGEAYLFKAIDHPTPDSRRNNLAQFFRAAKSQFVPAPYRENWNNWLESLAVAATSGSSILPFTRDAADANHALLTAIHGVLNWQSESLIRYASARITGNSKTLEALRPRVESALRTITESEETTLETFGILKVPRSVNLHGPLRLRFEDAALDLSTLSGPFTLSATDIENAVLHTTAPILLTVENESVFLELARRNPGVLLIQTSYPGSATCQLIAKLPADLSCYHFGDSDPAGFDILRDLITRTGRSFQPVLMNYKPCGEKLTNQESKLLAKLISSPQLHILRPTLEQISSTQLKGKFEQEQISIELVINEIISLIPAS